MSPTYISAEIEEFTAREPAVAAAGALGRAGDADDAEDAAAFGKGGTASFVATNLGEAEVLLFGDEAGTGVEGVVF